MPFRILNKCVKFCPLFQGFTKLRLTENMRVNKDDKAAAEFRKWLWDVGNGLNYLPVPNHPEILSDRVEIPLGLMAKDMADLLEFTFPASAMADPLKGKSTSKPTHL